MTTPVSSTFWQNASAFAAALGGIGAFVALFWRRLVTFLGLATKGDVRELETESATKAEVKALGDELRALHKEHVSADAVAFREVNLKLEHVQDTMARREDVRAVENTLITFLRENFGGRRP